MSIPTKLSHGNPSSLAVRKTKGVGTTGTQPKAHSKSSLGQCQHPGCASPALSNAAHCSAHTQRAKSSSLSRPSDGSTDGFSLTRLLSGFGRLFTPRSTPAAQTPSQQQKQKQTNAPTIKFYEKGQAYYELTNFAPYPIRYNGKDYPTSEHLFHALKFVTEEDAERIRIQPTPRAAMEEAKNLRSRVRDGWIDKRLNVKMMERVLLLKFTQHEQLKKTLLETGDATLVEDSPIDSFWGIGSNGMGANELGKALEKVRKSLQEYESS